VSKRRTGRSFKLVASKGACAFAHASFIKALLIRNEQLSEAPRWLMALAVGLACGAAAGPHEQQVRRGHGDAEASAVFA
jgi:hypothetical protein